MRTYKITWEIEIDAETPQAAAKKAHEIQLDPFSTATVFDVDGEHYDSDYDYED